MQPIKIISWNTDFIAGLGQHLAQMANNNPHALGTMCILFPHNRPARYLKKYLAGCEAMPKPFLLPEMSTLPDFASAIRQTGTEAPRKSLGRLDQVGLLHEVVSQLREKDTSGLLAQKLPSERHQFFGWGLLLARLMEELFRQNMTPGNLTYLEGELLPFAEALLSQLGSIFQLYKQQLDDNGWTTPGYDAFSVALNAEEIAANCKYDHIIAAGFLALGGAEDTLVKSLWKAGKAEIIWHSDTNVGTPRPSHPAVREHEDWTRDWRAETEDITPSGSEQIEPDIRFFEAFDKHSQLHALGKELAALPDEADTAIVIPDTGLLIPILHHMPEREINISMGYPLHRTPVFQLLDITLSLQERRNEDGTYSWRLLRNLIRHPYVRQLDAPDRSVWMKLLQNWEFDLRKAKNNATSENWLPAPETPETEDQHIAEATLALFNDFVTNALTGFSNITTLSLLAQQFENLVTFLHANGQQLWHERLIDAECLVRIHAAVLPDLRGSMISNDQYPFETLTSIFRELARQERVSFEPEPLMGMQVMGMLETRLLHFRRLFILDATESRLPGTSDHDPLLPDNLRSLLGLPDARQRDNVAAYNFYRLIKGSDETTIFYPAGESPGILDGSNVRSRFVEQLIWDEEQRQGRIIHPGIAPLFPVNLPLSPLPSGKDDIPKTPELVERIQALLSRGLSPTMLDAYMTCPKNFYFRYLARLRPLQDVDETGDKAAFGDVVHEVLQELLEPHKGSLLTASQIDGDVLAATFLNRLRTEPFYARMPHDAQLALEIIGKERLLMFSRELPDTTVLDLEQEICWTLDKDTFSTCIKGKADRIDERANGIIVLDYKTGSVKKCKKGFFEDQDLWDSIATVDPSVTAAMDVLTMAQDKAQSLQLPLYMKMYQAQHGILPTNAAWVELRDKGRETSLFSDKVVHEDKADAILTKLPKLVALIIETMLENSVFAAVESKACSWCDYKGFCSS